MQKTFSPLVLYQNVRGLRTKLIELNSAIASVAEPYDIMILTETWLNDSFLDSELGFTNYNIFKMDRNSENSMFSRGGGVLSAVHKSLNSRLIEVSIKYVEHLFAVVRMNRRNLVIGGVYFPPGSEVNIYESHCCAIEEITEVLPYADILIVGNFNFPRTHWHNGNSFLQCDAIGGGRITKQANVVLRLFNELNLYQFNGITNIDCNILALVFSTVRNVSVDLAVPLMDCDPYHPALKLSMPIYCKRRPIAEIKWIRDFKKADCFH